MQPEGGESRHLNPLEIEGDTVKLHALITANDMLLLKIQRDKYHLEEGEITDVVEKKQKTHCYLYKQ